MLTASPAPLSGPAIDSSAGLSPESNNAMRPHHPVPRWLELMERFVRVVLRLYFGLIVCYLPWSGRVLTFFPWSHNLWDHNPLWDLFPTLGSIANTGAVRGLVSGLGLLNLWIAFKDAIRHRDG